MQKTIWILVILMEINVLTKYNIKGIIDPWWKKIIKFFAGDECDEWTRSN